MRKTERKSLICAVKIYKNEKEREREREMAFDCMPILYFK